MQNRHGVYAQRNRNLRTGCLFRKLASHPPCVGKRQIVLRSLFQEQKLETRRAKTMPSIPSDEIHGLLKSGKMADAWELAKSTGISLGKWPQGEARRAAASLASSLGANRLTRVLDWLNWRGDRTNPEYFLQALFCRLSSTPEIKLIPEIDEFLSANPSIPAKQRAELLALRSWLLAGFRDFGPAHNDIHEALELAPDVSWIHVEHSSVLELEDRYEEALEAADRAVALRPYYRAAVLQRSGILVHLGRDEEAIAMLEEADRSTQSAAFAGHLQSFYSEREDHARGLECLARFEERSPLADESLKKWIASRRADFLFMAGDLDAYLGWAQQAGKGFHRIVAENLAKPGARQKSRVRLRVPFIRQHNMTCAPATLAALSRFWGKDHDHLVIADAICHDGTPWHKERAWAEENGFITREFRVTAESSRALIDRGIPFTLTTQAATSAHLQACIGYDERAGILLLRDPTNRHFGEVLLEGLAGEHPIAGPRGMVMIPAGESSRLDGILLPDQEAYSAYHELLVALDTNDRMKVEAARVLLRMVAPGQPLHFEGEQRIAIWKQDWGAYLTNVEAILATAPEHQPTLLKKAGALRQLGRWHELRAFLRQQVSGKASDPVFHAELGELLMEDARHLAEAERYLWKAMRYSRREARIFESMGRCLTTQNKHAEAARFRRVSAALSGTFEPYSRGYFDACRSLRRSAEGLDFLRERVSRMGPKSAGPWLTLAEALSALDRADEAAQVLRDAVAMRPEDGELTLSAGEMMVSWGGAHRVTGEQWIADSRGKATEADWLSASARTAAHLGDRPAAIRCWRAILRVQPQSTAAWRGLARNIAEDEGEDEVIRMLDEATAAHSEDAALWILKAEWLADTERGPLEALDRALALRPDDNWAIRERALRRMQAGDKTGAESDARHAVILNPWSAYAHGALGQVLEDAGKIEEAVECFRAAVKLDVDFTLPARHLISIPEDIAEKREALDFIESEMRNQVSKGEILPSYQSLAWSLIDPPLLMERLQEFCSERPDLWQTWAASIEQALAMRTDVEALLAAEEITSRFPLLPRAWLELGRVHRAAGRHSEEETAIARACEISPGWDYAARCHAAVLEQLGRKEEAISALRRAVRLNPLNGPNYGELADSLRRIGKKEESFQALFEAMRFTPFYGWAWNAAAAWSLKDGDTSLVAAKLREAEQKHGHHQAWPAIAAEAWDCLGEPDEALAAIRRGLVRAPNDANLRDSLARQLAERGEFVEALAACAPVGEEAIAPLNLRGRQAWLLMRSGQPLKGVAEMKALVDAAPDYGWGFNELASWHYDRSEWKQLRELCIRWLRASPSDSKVLGYLGMAELGLENPAEAKAAFARAHATDPENIHTARQLMDLQMKDRDFAAAETTYHRLRHYASGPYITCDGIELALKTGDVAKTMSGADELLADPTADENVFGIAAELFKKDKASSEWNNWLTERMKSGTHPAPGSLVAFLRILPEKKLFKSAGKWIAREKEGGQTRIAAWDFITAQAIKRRDTDTLRRLRDRNRAEFSASGRLWRSLGHAFLELNQPKDGVAWAADWESRSDDMNSGAYVNIAALHDSCPGDENRLWAIAGKIRAEGFRRFPGPSVNSQSLRACHALHLALEGKTDEAENLLADYDSAQLGRYYEAVGNSALALVAAARGQEQEAKSYAIRAMAFLSQYNDLGSLRTRKFTELALARSIPAHKGKIRRLRKSWYPGLQKPTRPGTRSFNPDLSGFPRWIIFPVIVVLINLLRNCSS